MDQPNTTNLDRLIPALTPPFHAQDIARYYQEGYLVARQLVPAEEIAAVMALATQIPPNADGSWTPRIFEHHNPLQEPGLHRLLVEPHMVAAVEQLLEAPARVYYGMLAIVPAKGGTGLAWHQDNMYNLVLGRALNAFVALDDITPDMAILWIAPRSHLQGVQESVDVNGHRVAQTPLHGVPLAALQAGDVVIFDRNTLHHSKINNTERHRIAYAAQYQEDKARSAQTGQHDASRMRAADLREQWRGLI